MKLSKQALQATIDDIHRTTAAQDKSIKIYRDEIVQLEKEKSELLQFIAVEESGGTVKGRPKYDVTAMKNNVDHLDDNIQDFLDEINAMEQAKAQSQHMIATLEVKRDTEGF